VSNLIQPNDLYRLYVAIQKRPIFKTSRTPENIQIMFYTLYIYTCSIHVDNVWQPYIKLFFSKRNRRSFRTHDLSPNVFDIMIRKPRWPFPFMFFVSPKELTITMGTKTIDLSSFPWSLEVLGSLLNCLLCIHIYIMLDTRSSWVKGAEPCTPHVTPHHGLGTSCCFDIAAKQNIIYI